MPLDQSSALSPAFRDQLAEAFAVLLGRPTAEDDQGAVYAAFYGGNFMSELEYHRDAVWLEPAILAGERTVTGTPFLLYDEGETPIEFDAAESVYEIWDTDGLLPAAFVADLATVFFSSSGPGRGLVRGRDLGAVLARHDDVDLLDAALSGTWSVCHARMPSDGTLVDALRVAVGIGTDPDSLVAFDGEAEEEWEAALAAVPDERLRGHLKLACQDPWQEVGICYRGDAPDTTVLADQGCTMVAAWEDGHGQLDIAVVRLSDVVLGRTAHGSSVG